jgi:pilus assembly protein CpaB
MDSTKKVKIVAVAAGLLALMLGFYYIRINTETEQDTVSVIKATQNIAANEKIDASKLAMVRIPVADAVSGAVTNGDAAVGMFAAENIYAGEQLVSSRLINQGSDSASSFAYKVPKGMRTVTISVGTTSSVSNLLQVGDHVDVIDSYTDIGDKNIDTDDRFLSKYVMTNAEIGALDTATVRAKESNSKASNGQTTDSGSEVTTFTTVTLFVTPEQAKQFAYEQANSSSTHSLTLTLRNPNDETEITADPFTEENQSQIDIRNAEKENTRLLENAKKEMMTEQEKGNE